MMAPNASARTATPPDPTVLLGPGDPPVFQFLPGRRSDALLLCDHASAAVPLALDRLGLPDHAFDRHIAVDLHAEAMTRLLTAQLELPAFLHGCSRLVVDANRHYDDPTLCPESSDGIGVPGNIGLAAAARQRRWQQLHQPYHDAIIRWVQPRLDAGASPALISMHSFAAEVAGRRRPWPVGVLWNRDGRMALPFMAHLRQHENLLVGDNQPYSGQEGFGYSMAVHAEAHGLPHLLIELRQDLLTTPAHRTHWAGLLARAIAPLLADAGLFARFRPDPTDADRS